MQVDDWTKHDGLKRLTQTEKGTSRSSYIQDFDDEDLIYNKALPPQLLEWLNDGGLLSASDFWVCG